MVNINAQGLPEKYEIIRGEESRYGLRYMGAKKEEVILEPRYIVCSAFKALGKVLLVYFVDPENIKNGEGIINSDDMPENELKQRERAETGYYVIRNRKGDLYTTAYDFAASNKFLFIQIKTNRGLELVSLDKDLNEVKRLGCLTFDDHYTKNGNRVLPSSRKSLEVRDKNGDLCRINLIDGTLDSVISFNRPTSKKTVTAKESVEPKEWTYELNLTKGKIYKVSESDLIYKEIASGIDLEKYAGDFVTLLNATPRKDIKEVEVKRHIEKSKLFVFDNIPKEKADLADKIVLTVHSSFKLVNMLLTYYKQDIDAVYKTLTEGFCRFFHIREGSINTDYSIKIVTLNNKAYFLIKNSSGKVFWLEENLHGLKDDTQYELVDYTECHANADYSISRALAKPAWYKGKNSSSYYERVIALDAKFTEIVREHELEENKEFDFSLMLFDRFTYGPLVKEDNSRRHNYNDSKIVLTTTTSDMLIMLE